MVRTALAYWRTPQSAYEPMPDAKDVEPMGEDADFTGRTLRAWEYGGSQYQVQSWKQMLVQVIALMAELDAAGVHRAASDMTWLKLHPDSAVPVDQYYREAAPGIAVHTDNSTATKMWILRNLFHRLGVDTDELVFYLTPEAAVIDE